MLATACTKNDSTSLIPPTKFDDLNERWSETKTAFSGLSQSEQKFSLDHMSRAVLAEAPSNVQNTAMTTGLSAMKKEEWRNQQAIEKNNNGAAEKIINAAVTITIVSLHLKKKNPNKRIYSDHFEISMEAKNNSKKTLTEIKGSMRIMDISGKIIKDIELYAYSNIKTGASTTYTAIFDHNNFMEADKKLAITDVANLKFQWLPVEYIYRDGSSLESAK